MQVLVLAFLLLVVLDAVIARQNAIFSFLLHYLACVSSLALQRMPLQPSGQARPQHSRVIVIFMFVIITITVIAYIFICHIVGMGAGANPKQRLLYDTIMTRLTFI